MSGAKIPLHGRSHGPNGSDPAPSSGIQFDTDPQEGGYLHISTTAWDPSDTAQFAGIGLYASGGNPIVVANTDNWIQLIYAPTGGGGGVREIRITDQKISLYTIYTSIDMQDGASGALSDIFFVAGTTSMDLAGTGGLKVKVPTSGALTVVNQANSQIFQVGDFSGTKKLSFFAATPQAQFSAITAPTGGGTVDAEARTAIGSILTMLGATAGGYGLTA